VASRFDGTATADMRHMVIEIHWSDDDTLETVPPLSKINSTSEIVSDQARATTAIMPTEAAVLAGAYHICHQAQ
jgi:hypothetical protein